MGEAYHGLAIGDVSEVRERSRYLEIYNQVSKSLSLTSIFKFVFQFLGTIDNEPRSHCCSREEGS
jgi:hypothetical protein